MARTSTGLRQGQLGVGGLCLDVVIGQRKKRLVQADVEVLCGDGQTLTEERLAYPSAFVTVRTPAIDTLTTSVRTLMVLGRHQQTTARPSLIVTGPAAAGKTTALLHVGRACHLAHARSHPPPAPPARLQVPVAYVLVPPAASAKALATEFARYLGIPVTARMTQAQITDGLPHLPPGRRPPGHDRRDPPPQPPHHHRC